MESVRSGFTSDMAKVCHSAALRRHQPPTQIMGPKTRRHGTPASCDAFGHQYLSLLLGQYDYAAGIAATDRIVWQEPLPKVHAVSVLFNSMRHREQGKGAVNSNVGVKR